MEKKSYCPRILNNKKSSIKSMDTKSSIKSVSLNIGTDPEDTILNAFKMFDPEAKGYIHTAE